ncbi:hypothetical protein SY88_10285 [Clostridiales bacterium PH28_bin88]|nr:hypothetical protein SY88_10285 [Clostridiales bacterium PH28_bin88]
MKVVKVKKVGVWLLVAVILIAAAGAGWRYFSARRNTATAQSTRVLTAKVERGDLEVKVSGTGAVEAAAQEEVRTRMSGTITRFDMKDGQQVTAGQLLAELEVQDLSLQIEKARLDITIQERDLAKLRQEKTLDTVKSPGNGEITWKVKEGDRVSEGNVIATIQDRNRLEVVGRFNSAQLEQIKPGQEAQVFIQEFLSTVPARVVEVRTDPRPGSAGSILYEVKAEIENPGSLDAGMQGWLTVLTPAGERRAVEESVFTRPDALDVRAPISGKITALRVDSGKRVSTGQALAEVSDPDSAEQLVNQIATAELKLQQTRLDLQDKERQQADRAQKSQVLAPIGGTLVLPAKPAGVGDDVSQGTVLGTVVDYSQMQVVIPVDELDVDKVKPGQEVRITADALTGKTITGQVVSVSSQGTSQSGVATFDVTVAIQPVEGLKVGMTVNADIMVDYRQNTLLVPIEAVQQAGGRSFVLVAGAPGPDGQAATSRRVQVKTGAYDTSRMEILEGLAEGQEVLVQGAASRSGSVQGNRTGVPGGAFPIPGMGGSFSGQRTTPQRGVGQ